MSARERQHKAAVIQAVEGIGLVVLVSGGVWAIAVVIAAIVAWMF
jgi:hypothetical protein